MILSLVSPKTKHSVQLFTKKYIQKLKGITKDEKSFIGIRLKEDVSVISLFKMTALKFL